MKIRAKTLNGFLLYVPSAEIHVQGEMSDIECKDWQAAALLSDCRIVVEDVSNAEKKSESVSDNKTLVTEGPLPSSSDVTKVTRRKRY
jgi:hypothetical protein